MVRRDFLKVSGLLSAALMVQVGSVAKVQSLPIEAELNGKIYRGTLDGKIHVSADAGRTWSLHTQFGTEFAIRGLSVDSRKRVVAVIDYQGYDFRLALSADSRTWRTV